METANNQGSNRGDGAQEQTLPPTDLDELEAQVQLSHTWLRRRSDLLEIDPNGSFAPLFDALDRSEPAQDHDWP